jgi:molybdate transport system ATP-binding protein
VASSDRASGPVGVAVYPWEITLEPAGAVAHGSALNRIEATVSSVTEIGNRARIGLLSSQPFAAEITSESVTRLGLAPGAAVTATWKATATRLVER